MVKSFFRLFVGFLFSMACFSFFLFSTAKTTLPAEGDYTFYLYSKSSDAQITTVPKDYAPVFSLLHRAQITGERSVLTDDPRSIEEILSSLGGTLLFVEECGDVTSYYCYADGLSSPVFLNGTAVNLHLAVRGNTVCMGTPLIFGGF